MSAVGPNNAPYEEIEEEVEYSEYEEGDEVEGEEEVEGDDDGNNNGAEPVASPSGKGTPGKINASPAVKKMVMKTPEQHVAPAGKQLPVGKNPFTTFGAWTENTLREITIEFPVLTSKNETTNDLTRSTRPEARYWKAPILFKYGPYTSNTIRFDNVHIPYSNSKRYGSGFVYLCLPGFAAEIFAEAGKARRPTRVTEKSLMPDKARWWKVANDVENTFGVINNSTKKFQARSLETLFDASGSGITATVVLRFEFKASTEEKEPLKQTTMGNVAVRVERAFISAVDVNVEMPTKVSRTKQKVEPSATTADIATDALMARLSALGL